MRGRDSERSNDHFVPEGTEEKSPVPAQAKPWENRIKQTSREGRYE